ncbi:MAG: hypothetical protein AAFP83_21550 [Bacteroidota bacterium]
MKFVRCLIIGNLIEERDEDFLLEAIETLEAITDAPGIKDEEMDVLGEMLSNLYGAVEVHKSIQEGQPKREALNGFMTRVTGSIDQ